MQKKGSWLHRFLVFALFVPAAWAQTASLGGRVLDSSGAVVVDVAMEALDVATNIRFNATTNSEGLFLFPTLRPGSYVLSAQAIGFAESRLNQVVLEVGQTGSLTITLQPAGVAEFVEAVESAPLLETIRADRGAVIENSFVLSVPLNVRNPLQLVNFTPGVTAGGLTGSYNVAGTNTVSQTQTNAWRINGGKASTNEILLDGATNIQAYGNQAAAVPQVDSVQEFRVLTSPYAPEYGRTVRRRDQLCHEERDQQLSRNGA